MDQIPKDREDNAVGSRIAVRARRHRVRNAWALATRHPAFDPRDQRFFYMLETLTPPTNTPRTGPQLIRATKPYANDDPARSWWCLLSTLVLMSLAFAAATFAPHPALRFAASILSGLLLVRMFVIYHDHQHRAILPKSRPAAGLMWLFGVFVVSPSSVWRAAHNHHHNHNSKLRGAQIGSFPILTVHRFSGLSRLDQWKYLAVRHPLTIFGGYIPVFLVGMCLLPFLQDPRKHFDGLLALILHGAIAVVLISVGGVSQLLLSQTLPFLIAGALGTYLFYAQHNFPAVSFHVRDDWTYEKAALESSSYLRMDPVMAWFTANIGYHHIHHLNAKIPFYRLDEVMREIPELQNARTITLHPADVWSCLRLKLWDTERGRMVPLPGARKS